LSTFEKGGAKTNSLFLSTFEKGTSKGFALFFKREVEPKPTLYSCPPLRKEHPKVLLSFLKEKWSQNQLLGCFK